MNRPLPFFLLTTLLTLLIAGDALFAWTAPAAVPPSSNVAAPLHTGDSSQIKGGGLGVGSLDVAGGARVGGSLTVGGAVSAPSYLYTSDAALKTNIAPIAEPLQVVEALRAVSFNWRDSGSSTYGFIAQEVATTLPELVSTSPTGYLGVEYSLIIPFLVGAVQEQQREIDRLRELLNAHAE